MYTISKEKKKEFICALNIEEQRSIKEYLRISLQLMGLTEKEEKRAIKRGMNGRVCDLEDTFEIRYV